ncbi:MAG: preprotein translocase subunit SecA [Tepidisphaeraceae bacterium]|jgi:preprotein translocase subunit SecA
MAFSFQKILTRIFGSRNERLLKKYRATVAQINAWEPRISILSDPELAKRTQEMRDGIREGRIRIADVQSEAMAIMRESMDRNIGIRQIFNTEEDPLNKFDPDRLSDADLELYDSVQRRMIQTGESWTRVPIPPGLYKAIRELYPDSRPPFRARCFDVQLIGGLVLYEGKIAEMATGEGKTFVAPLACFLRVLQGMHCHVVTVNDYLVRRDANWVRPAFEALGVSIGFIQSDMDPGGEGRRKEYQCDITYGTNSEFGFDYLRDNMKETVDHQSQGKLEYAIVDEVDSILIDEARTPLIISGAAHDDAEKYIAADRVARKIIELHKPCGDIDRQIDACKRAGKAAEGDIDKHKGERDEVESARQRQAEAEARLVELEEKKKGVVAYYEVELDRKSVHLTHEGIQAAQDEAGVGSFYSGNNMEWPHLMEQALRAHVVYEKDKDYVVERGQRSGDMEVVIVDEYTGRKMIGRQWSEGLHQAVEAKERVPVKQETQTLATVTLQNFFKLYKKIAGMTGTAQTEAEEFMKIYKLEVVTIPTNRPVIRCDHDDRVFRSDREKWEAIIEEIKLCSDCGRPILVGTTSVEKSEKLSALLKRKYGIEHDVLNAKQHEREADIVAKAGHRHQNAAGEWVGNVTVATNMAGRGTDIKLLVETLWDVECQPHPDKKGQHRYKLTQRGSKQVVEVDSDDPKAEVWELAPHRKVAGGLHVIGTERHTARRIDNQLRGRSGRQGDPGSSRFYVSLEDELMKLFAGEWTIKVLGWLGMEEGMAIEDKRISKGILRAQKKVEERNFSIRKNLLEYDEVMDYQRTQFYGMRQRVLEGRQVDEIIWGMIGHAVEDALRSYIDEDYVAACVCEWAKTNFSLSNLEPSDYSGLKTLVDLENFIKGHARTDVESDISSLLTEYMGEDREAREWDTKSLVSEAMRRYQVNLSQGQLKKMSPDEVEQMLIIAASEQIDKRDCAPLAQFIEPFYAEKQLANWAREKFSLKIDPMEMIADPERHVRKPSEQIAELIETRARQVYAQREIEYPIDHLLTYVYGGDGASADDPYRAEYVQAWAVQRYREELSLDEIRSLARSPEQRRLRDRLIGLQEQYLEDGRIDKDVDEMLARQLEPAALAKAFNERFVTKLSAADVSETRDLPTDDPLVMRKELPRDRMIQAARGFFRRELSELEQFVLISIFDQSWKDHLYAMDMLRSSIGLVGFAEKDPRVVFKKEGHRYFQEMMEAVRAKVTDLIFRARLAGPVQARSAYQVTAATHQDAGGYGVGENIQQYGGAAAPQQEGQPQAVGSEASVVTKPIVNEGPKVGRNDPCPCGSGRKYKKCCGRNAA